MLSHYAGKQMEWNGGNNLKVFNLQEHIWSMYTIKSLIFILQASFILHVI